MSSILPTPMTSCPLAFSTSNRVSLGGAIVSPRGVCATEQCASHFADVIQLLNGDDFFVGSHLEDAVGAGIDDRLAGAFMLFPQLLNNHGARGRMITQRLTTQ